MIDPPMDISVPDNYIGVYSLNGNNFRRITVGKNSVVQFMNSGDIYINELILKDADEGKTTRVTFSGNTALLIRHKLEAGKRNRFNQAGTYAVKVYVEEEDIKIGQSSVFTCNIDARFKTLSPEDGTTAAHTVLTGQFIAKKVDSKKWVDWNGSCGGSEAGRVADLTKTEQKKITAPQSFIVSVAPNPSTSDFTFRLNTQSNLPVKIRVIDAFGIVRLTLFNVGPITNLGSELKTGIYFAEVSQGNAQQKIKLVKIE